MLLDLDEIDPNLLPEQWTISSIAFAELAAGPVAAQAYALVYGAVIRAGRKPRGRAFDLLIASTALAEGLDLYTRNPQDFRGLEELLNVISV